jgi:NitT/TauT family transport system permease protein
MIAAWYVAAVIIGKEFILPNPLSVASRFAEIAPTPAFLGSIASTSVRVVRSFALSLLIGATVGLLSAASPRWKAAFGPPMTAIRATPVLAIVLLLLYWFGQEVVPEIAAILMAFPVAATAFEEGSRAVDVRLMEMGKAYGFDAVESLIRIRIPSLAPFALSAAANSMGLCWKVVIAAEILTQPPFSIGKEMQDARAILESTDVFCWAIVSIALCATSELAFSVARRWAGRHGLVA